MAKEVVNVTGGEFYVREARVFRSPIETTYADGSKGHSLGFVVCECSTSSNAEYVREALALATNNISLEHYSEEMSSSAIYPNAGTLAGLMYVVLKLNGEAGEIAEKLGKLLRDQGMRADQRCREIPPDWRDAMIRELGDVLWYVNQAAKELGVPLRELYENNLSKLASRKSRGKLGGSGDNR